jgi:hypothetical protein
MQRFWAVLILAAATTVSTQPAQCLRQPGASANLPTGYAVYRTERVVTPYELADRFYGHGYLAQKIINANRMQLFADGTFPQGVDLVLPPDDKGQSVPMRLLKGDKHY